MLTDFVESDKVKCTRYWPKNKGVQLSLDSRGHVSLSHEEKIFSLGEEELWLSHLQLKFDNVERQVIHYWLKGWKDGKSLKNLDVQMTLLDKMHGHAQKHPENTPIVHCSGGVGRTGTIIGAYLARHLIEWSTAANHYNLSENLPFEITLYLRSQRSHLLHTLDQYISFNHFVQTTQGKIKNEKSSVT
jgi:protein-tyrosine phosphatase